MDIIPYNQLLQRCRDPVGRCNQVIAAFAEHVFLVSCGIPMQLKQPNPL